MSSFYDQERRRKAVSGTSKALNAATTGVSTGLFIAAASSNAVPVAGQVAAGVLALAGALTKVFAGKRMAKREQQANLGIQARQQNQQFIQGQGQMTQGNLAGGAQADPEKSPIQPPATVPTAIPQAGTTYE